MKCSLSKFHCSVVNEFIATTASLTFDQSIFASVPVLNVLLGRVFSDELFDGKEYTLQVKEQLRSDTKYYTKRHIRLYSLSEPYYQYLLSLQNIKNEGIMGGLTNVGLAEPVRIYSNVEGGTGIAGGCQWFESLVDIKDLIK